MQRPMFPLGTVLFPGLLLPLHVFEPRYRALVRDCLEGDREFGVVLIERGSEVGGDDVRSDYGTLARIVEAQELPDGRWVLATVGTQRVRVTGWLPDDPYPRAALEPWGDGGAGSGGAQSLERAVATLRRVLALAAELGEHRAESTIEFATDPLLASYQACAVSPLGPLDQHRLLGVDGLGDRLTLLNQMLAEEETYLRARLALG